MDLLYYVALAFIGLVLLYLGVRVVGAAWFKSKQQFDRPGGQQ